MTKAKQSKSYELRGSVKLTYKEFQRIPYDGLGHHLIKGLHIVTPAPSTKHQEITGQIFNALLNFVHSKKIGKVFTAPIDVKFSEYDGYQPDIIYIDEERIQIIQENYIAGPPNLIIEITIPESAKADYGWKMNLARKSGVEEYWVVDTVYKLVEVFNFSLNKDETSKTFIKTDSLRSFLPQLSLKRF